MDVNKRISNILIKYLKAERDIEAVSAHFGVTYGGDNDGCDTCGWGSTGMSWEIRYKRAGDQFWNNLEILGDPLDFLPTLLEYDKE